MIFEEIGDRAGDIGAVCVEAPQHVGVSEAAEHLPEALAVDVRGMGIAVAVGDLMMPAMGRAPADAHALPGGGAEDRQKPV